jgi:nucleoside-diphosphate-sugar epimerase
MKPYELPRRVLITGVTGRVGSELAVRLANEGCDVIGVISPDDVAVEQLKARVPEAELHTADLSVERIPSAAVDGVDAVVHLAALLRVGTQPPEDLYDLNTLGLLRVLEPFVERRRSPRVVFASTDGAYGNVGLEDVVFSEDAPLVACDYYSNSKAMAETLLRSLACQYSFPYVILRFSTVIARGAAAGFFRLDAQRRRLLQVHNGRRSNLWPLFDGAEDMYQLLSDTDDATNPPIALIGPGGKPWRMPLVDVRDVVEALSLTLMVDPCPNAICNVSGPAAVDQLDALRMLEDHLAIDGEVVHVPRGWRYDVDISKAIHLLGYRPKWSFAEMLVGGYGDVPAVMGDDGA